MKRTTGLSATIALYEQAGEDTVGEVRINDHEVWQDVYPAGTTHEQVLEDVLDTLGAALRREKGLA